MPNNNEPELTSNVEVTLIVPVYEEKDNIVPFVTEVKRVVQIPHQICIIYDHPDDNTLTRMSEVHAIEPSVLFIQNLYGNGIINAFKTGFDVSKTHYVVAIMADLSDTPSTINDLYAKIEEGYDLVVASRYCEGGKKIGGPRLKYWLSKTANLMLNRLTGIPTHDMTNAYIIHKKHILDSLHIRSTGGFEITMEIIAKSFVLGARIAEVPTINRDRNAGASKFRLLHWISKYLYWFFYILSFSIVHRINSRYHRDSRKPPVNFS